MQRRTSAMCWLIISTGLVLACALPAKAAETTLQGTWIATKAEQDGKAADDLVGHRLSFMGNRFEIRSKDDKPLYAGTVQINPSAKPATIDFQQKKGALNGKVWKGIYAVDGDTLTTCDNAPNLKKGRPAAFEAKSGSGYVLITFKRAKPETLRSTLSQRSRLTLISIATTAASGSNWCNSPSRFGPNSAVSIDLEPEMSSIQRRTGST